MLFNVISVTALAALAHAAPWPASSSEAPADYTPAGYSTVSSVAASSTESGKAGSISTVTKTVSICSGSGSGLGSKSTAAASTGTARNLDVALAKDLAKQMHAEVSAVDRFNDLLTINANGTTLLSPAEIQQRIVFDFNAAKPAPNATGGRILVASQRNFPALTDLGIGGAVAFLEPCSMNTPHTHPRATELLTVVQGKLQTGMMLENNFVAPKNGQTTQISAELGPFQATVFPQGSIHFQFNPTCDNAVFVAGLSSSDPGTSQVAQNFFFEDEKIVKIALGEKSDISELDFDKVRSQMPVNLVQAMDTCVATCKAQGKL